MNSKLDLSLGQATKKWAQTNNFECWYQPQTTSTNFIAKNETSHFSHFKIFVCDHQTQGRGRGQHTWLDEQQTLGQFLSSWMFTLPQTPQPILSAAVGLALWTAARASFPGLNWSLKAPNDLYLGEKKVAGILLETFNQPQLKKVDNQDWSSLIIGIGINIFSSPKEIETATSVQEHWQNVSCNNISEQHFLLFLDHLYFELRQALGLSVFTSDNKNWKSVFELQQYQCENLKYALNLFPHLSEKYRNVLANGDLITDNKHISWSEL